MYKYERHLISYIIIDKLNERYDDIFDSKTLIYLLCATADQTEEPDQLLNNINQNNFSIYHKARASKSKYSIDRIIYNDNFISIDNNNVIIQWEIDNTPRSLTISEIPEYLDDNEYLINSLKNSSYAIRLDLLNKIKSLANDEENDAVHPKINALYNLIKAISGDENLNSQIQNDENPGEEERFLQTVIGAALFYCPSRINDHWDGKISIEALKNKVFERGSITKDHQIPRRLGAINLMSRVINNEIRSPEGLQNYYDEHLAKFTFVTPEENRRLVNYFLEYTNYETASDANGIISFPDQQRFVSKLVLNRFISHLQGLRLNENNFISRVYNELNDLNDDFLIDN